MDQEPIVNALIASFLALGGAVDEGMLQRTGNNLRALIYDPDSALQPRTIHILEDILIGLNHQAMSESRKSRRGLCLRKWKSDVRFRG